MGILNKLSALTRSAARESAEVLIDANRLRIFEQEIVDVENILRLRKQSLSEMMLAKKQLGQEALSIQNLVTKREAQACELSKEKETEELLEAIAEDIVQHEISLSNLKSQSDFLAKRILNAESSLRKGLSDVVQFRRDLRLLKSQEITKSLSAKPDNLAKVLSELEHSHRHVKALQTDGDDRESIWEDMEEKLADNDVQKKVNDIELRKWKEAVLARIKSGAT